MMSRGAMGYTLKILLRPVIIARMEDRGRKINIYDAGSPRARLWKLDATCDSEFNFSIILTMSRIISAITSLMLPVVTPATDLPRFPLHFKHWRSNSARSKLISIGFREKQKGRELALPAFLLRSG